MLVPVPAQAQELATLTPGTTLVLVPALELAAVTRGTTLVLGVPPAVGIPGTAALTAVSRRVAVADKVRTQVAETTIGAAVPAAEVLLAPAIAWGTPAAVAVAATLVVVAAVPAAVATDQSSTRRVR